MWGTPTHCAQDREKLRFIPTHVGNTIFVLSLQSSVAVHPHACGEHMSTHQKVMNHHGSSPRMWGTHRLCLLMNKDKRFIPTHVGNTVRYAPHHLPYAVHPHACGEHLLNTAHNRYEHGSSPRMWGTLRASFCHRPPPRFIPTHVGNTINSSIPLSTMPVHPHACGEHIATHLRMILPCGSSPRMWGTHQFDGGRNFITRFIPTHVGNTTYLNALKYFYTVHPHACGEHSVFGCMDSGFGGSSPRMWGTLIFLLMAHCPPRFIPTHVGNTLVSGIRTFQNPVHPHACGEHT